MIKGSCHCGQVEYESTGKVMRFVNCHCEDCRKVSGAAFSSSLVVEAGGFSVTKGEDKLTAYESSPGKFRCFCKNCGSPIVARMNYKPEIVIIRAGVLDQLGDEKPTAHIWVCAKAPWCDINDDLQQYHESIQ